MWRDRTHGEDGIALVAAMLAVIIIGGLVAVMVATAQHQTRATGVERRFETSVHAAEAGADEVILNVNEDLSYVTRDSSGDDHVYNPGAMTEQEWVLAEAANTNTVTTAFGEAVGIRPKDTTTGRPIDVIYGVGYVPSRGHPAAKVRVLKYQVEPGDYSPSTAILIDGDLHIGQGANVGGFSGNVHANGNVHISATGGDCSNDGFCVTGDLTASGDINKTKDELHPQNVQGDVRDFEDGVAPQPVRVFSVKPDFYLPWEPVKDAKGIVQRPKKPRFEGTEPVPTKLNSDPSNSVEARWWDLCPGGEVKTPAEPPDANTYPEPCTGQLVWKKGVTNNFHGWSWNGTWQGNSVVTGAYYVHRSNASINGARGAVTVLASAISTAAGGAEGNLKFGGNTGGQGLKPALPNVLFVADRDVEFAGTSGSTFEGFIGAREQVDARGNGSLTGTIVGANKSLHDPENVAHTTGSPVSQNAFSGNLHVTYDTQLRIPIPGITLITAWNEM